MGNVHAKTRLFLVSLALLLLLGPTILAGETEGTLIARLPAQPESDRRSLQCPDPPQANAICDDCSWQLGVYWDAVLGATAYIVERDTDAGFSSPEEIYRGTDRELIVIGLEGRYCFRVRAETANCTTGWSNVACDSCDRRPGPTIHPISNPDGDGNYEIRWGSSVVAGNALLPFQKLWVEIQEDTSPSFGNPRSFVLDHSPLIITDHPPGTYYYRARYDHFLCGLSEWSNVESVTVLEPVQYWFNGYVYDNDTGQGIADVTVKLYRWTGTEWTEINSKTTNQTGLFGLYASAQSGKYAVVEINPVGYESTRAEPPAGFDAEVIDADRIEFDDPPVGVVGPSLFYDVRPPTATPSATPTPTVTITSTAVASVTPSTTPVATGIPTVTRPPEVYLPLVLKRPGPP